jgi:hypothetical protein
VAWDIWAFNSRKPSVSRSLQLTAANPRKNALRRAGVRNLCTVDYMKVNYVVNDVRNITGGDGAHAVFVTPGTALA